MCSVCSHWELASCWHIRNLVFKPRFFTAGQTVSDATVEVEARHGGGLLCRRETFQTPDYQHQQLSRIETSCGCGRWTLGAAWLCLQPQLHRRGTAGDHLQDALHCCVTALWAQNPNRNGETPDSVVIERFAVVQVGPPTLQCVCVCVTVSLWVSVCPDDSSDMACLSATDSSYGSP